MFEIIQGKLEKAQKAVFYGPEGIGKSSFASQLPDPLFIDTEGSTNNLNVKRLSKPTSWTMLLQQVDYVKQNPQLAKTLVIDTVDWAEMLCINHVCAQHGKKGIEDFGYGNGYVYVKEEFGRLLNKLSDLIEVGVHVCLTAHSQIIKFEQPDEMGAYDRYQLKLGKKTSSQTAPLVKEWADMVLFMNYKTYSVATDDKGKKHKGQGGIRTIYANHHPAWDAKNRHGLPDEFPMDFNRIGHIFYSASPAARPDPVSQPAIQPAPEAPQSAPIQEQLDVRPTHDQLLPAIEEPVADPFPKIEKPPLNPAIPKALQDLMIPNGVTEEEIQAVVSQRGYYPIDTPIENYDPGFVEGVLIGAWPQVFVMIETLRNTLPFDL